MLNGMRIGHGFDVHAFDTAAGEGAIGITLGGVNIPYRYRLKAHSDGDVLLHALCDALLGAAALGDIGYHFPDTDPAWRGVDSRVLLRQVAKQVSRQGLGVANVDVTVIAQAPKLAPYINAMRKTIADDLNLSLNQVNVKATTTERLGYIGRGEGIAVHAVTLLSSP